MIHRRTLLIAGLSPLIARPAVAQSNWPDRSIRIVVPFAAGSFTDIAARLLATELTEQLGQPVVVENRGGAGSTAGTQAVARAEPDGYTLVLSDISLSISPGDLSEAALRSVARSRLSSAASRTRPRF